MPAFIEPNLSGCYHIDDNQTAAKQIQVIKPISGNQAPLTSPLIWTNRKGQLPGGKKALDVQRSKSKMLLEEEYVWQSFAVQSLNSISACYTVQCCRTPGIVRVVVSGRRFANLQMIQEQPPGRARG